MSVYFARRGRLIKIGWSRNVRHRISTLKAELIGCVPGGCTEERIIHSRFDHLRFRGEWFKPGEDLLKYIQEEAQGHEPDRLNESKMKISLPKSMIDRIDRLANRMRLPGLNVTRSRAFSVAAFRGLELLEAESFPPRKGKP